MKVITDQLSRKIELSGIPQRVVSLVPSQTEFLADHGLGARLVGVTKFCVHPKSIRSQATIVGGTKGVKIAVIKSLKPDLVIANKEENTKQDIDLIEKFTKVWVSDMKTETDAISMMTSLARVLNLEYNAGSLIQKFKRLEMVRECLGTALYLIWKNPYMAAGGDTFISRMLELAGFDNVMHDKTRYPEIDPKGESNLNPSHVFLSSEPYPFKDKHILELQKHFPNAVIRLVDGEVFSWYGTRMNYAVDYILKEFYEK